MKNKIYDDVSLRLRNKIRSNLDIIEGKLTRNHNYLATLSFDTNEFDLIEECREWLNTIETVKRMSHNAYRLTKIGRFCGVRPKEIYNSLVLFSVEEYKESSWKDWFVISTEESDGYFKGLYGNVINKRTHPQYYKDKKYIWEKEK